MKTLITLFITASLIGFAIYSCEKDKANTPQSTFKGQLISKSACKSFLKSTRVITDITNTPDSLVCIGYSFDNSTNKLSIKHINAGFNCCQDTVYCNVSLSVDTILIQEIEQNPKCDCDCLYDLNIEIQGVDAKKYQIKVIEPYVGDQKKILFEIDLTKDKVGSFCVTRKQYPWGMKSLNN
ncbi:MAG TPA: hypothetical protein PK252_02335 [Bacteroidales bacterium]|nr:hypothetical protein [Bacteroidales bacterium]